MPQEKNDQYKNGFMTGVDKISAALVDFCDEMMRLTLYYSQVEKLICHCGSNVVEASLGTAELATERFLAKSD